MTHLLRITFHGYWHVGNGRGSGPAIDAAVVRTAGGLPYLPGRALKGSLRSAVEEAEDLERSAPGSTGIPQGCAAAWFGTPLPEPEAYKGQNQAALQFATRFDPDEGLLWITSARLGATPSAQDAWEAWALAGRQARRGGDIATGAEQGAATDHLFATVSSTALSGGTAKPESLRTMEVVVPLTLHAFVRVRPGADAGAGAADWADSLARALPLVRAVGKERTRGLGRCTLALEAMSEGAHAAEGAPADDPPLDHEANP